MDQRNTDNDSLRPTPKLDGPGQPRGNVILPGGGVEHPYVAAANVLTVVQESLLQGALSR